MANFCVTAIALFCFFTLSIARTLPENDGVNIPVSYPLSEARPTLRRHSEPVNTETESNSAAVTAVPFTKVTFHPVNRRFPVRSKHPCRHHIKVDPRIRKHVQIPFGNDMIVSSGENSDFEDPFLHGGGRWVRLHRHGHRHHDEDSDSDDEKGDDRITKMVFKRYNYDRFGREKKLKVLKKMRKHFNEEEEKKKKGGFMKRVREFLDHYF